MATVAAPMLAAAGALIGHLAAPEFDISRGLAVNDQSGD